MTEYSVYVGLAFHKDSNWGRSHGGQSAGTGVPLQDLQLASGATAADRSVDSARRVGECL